MKPLQRLITIFSRSNRPCACGNVLVQFTGEPPLDQREHLIQRAAANRACVPLHWLEERIARDLYRAELSQGAAALDIGAWGPALFREEAARILAGMRQEFGYFVTQKEHADSDTEQRVHASI